MQTRACFWEAFGSERVNKFQKLLKSAEKYLYPMFPSFRAKLSSGISGVIYSEICAYFNA